MAKSITNSAFQNTTSSPGVGFNMVDKVNPAQDSFNEYFETKPLGEKEYNQLQRILVEDFKPSNTSENQVERDLGDLKKITEEIKSIGRQGLVMMGERIDKARDILKNYGDGKGSFTRWLNLTFGSRQTAYNMLAYYELSKALPHDVRKNFESLPQKIAYKLASRKGDVDIKTEIIKECDNLNPEKIDSLIQEKLPLNEKDRRSTKGADALLVKSIRNGLQKLLERKEYLSDELKAEIIDVGIILDELLDSFDEFKEAHALDAQSAHDLDSVGVETCDC